MTVKVEDKLFLDRFKVDKEPHLRIKDGAVCVERCEDQACLRGEECRLDRGSPYCYRASKSAHAMLDPYWIGGMNKHVKRIDIRYLFFLTNDPLSALLSPMEQGEALRWLEMGQASGTSLDPSGRTSHPFFNPHLLLRDSEGMERQMNLYTTLLKRVNLFKVNTQAAPVDDIAANILKTVGEGE